MGVLHLYRGEEKGTKLKQFLDIPYNVPSYGEIKIGDLILSYNYGFAMDRQMPCHCHLLRVFDKDIRYAKLHVKMIKCCTELEMRECSPLKESEINYSDMKKYSYLFRMATKTAQVLYGVRDERV